MTHEIPKEVIEMVAFALFNEEKTRNIHKDCSSVEYLSLWQIIPENARNIWRVNAKAAIQAAIESGYVVVNQWLPIETAPKTGEYILLFGTVKMREAAYYTPEVLMGSWCGDGLGWTECKFQYDPAQIAATHWMPLPNPPTKGDK